MPQVRGISLTARYLILKAGLVSLVAMAMARLLNLQDPITVVFASLLCIPPAFYRGLKSGLRNIYATLMGAVLAVVLTLLLRSPFLAIPPGVMLLCGVCYLLGWLEYFPLAVFTFLVLSFLRPEEIGVASIQRSWAIVVGIAAAMGINYLVSLLRYRDLYVSQFRQLFRNLVRSFAETERLFLEGNAPAMRRLEFRYHLLFRQISMFIDEMADLKNELRLRKESGGLSYAGVVWLARIADKLASIAHYSWDLVALSPDLLHTASMQPEEKKALDRDITLIARSLEGILRDVDTPRRHPAPPSAGNAVEYPAGSLHAGGDLGVVSLRVSLSHLQSEVRELSRIVSAFMDEIGTGTA